MLMLLINKICIWRYCNLGLKVHYVHLKRARAKDVVDLNNPAVGNCGAAALNAALLHL